MSDSVQPHRWQPTRLPHPWDSPGKNTGVGCHFLLQCMKVKSESEVAQSCLTPSNPMDCSLPGSSIHGISQARVLEWGAIAFSANCIHKNIDRNVNNIRQQRNMFQIKGQDETPEEQLSKLRQAICPRNKSPELLWKKVQRGA